MKVKGDIKKITVTQRQIAAAIGITPARVNQLIKDDVIVRDEDNPGGAVLLYESVKRFWLYIVSIIKYRGRFDISPPRLGYV